MELAPHQAIHQAAQYLATAAKSFLPDQAIDEHTSLYWDASKMSFISHPINEDGAVMAVNLEYYSLDFLDRYKEEISSFPIGGANHLAIINWIGREKYLLGIERDFSYEMHYDIPYPSLDDRSMLARLSKDDLLAHVALRTLADQALAEMKLVFDRTTELLIWPHHFDTGMLGYLDGMKHISSVGLGVAMPDDQFSEPYCYISAYDEKGAIGVNSFKPLTSGEWASAGFVGAVMPIANQTPLTLVAFMKEALAVYTNLD
jgi:hypothetical protein